MPRNISRRNFLAASGIGLSATVAGCLGDNGDEHEWEIAVATGEDNPMTIAANEFKESLEEESDDFNISITSGGAYGSEVEQADLLLTGEMEMVCTSLGVLESLNIGIEWLINATTFVYPEDRPYEAFEDFITHHLEENEPTSHLEDNGAIPLVPDGDSYRESFILAGGVRNIISQTPIEEPADAEGVPMRAAPSPFMQRSMLSIGFDSEVMPITEVFEAAQSGVIEASEGDPNQILGENLHEVMDYMTMTQHLPYGFWFVANADEFNDLSESNQELLLDVQAQTKQVAEDALFEVQAENLTRLEEEHGIEIIDDIDRSAFQELAIEGQREWFEENEDSVPMSLDEIIEVTGVQI